MKFYRRLLWIVVAIFSINSFLLLPAIPEAEAKGKSRYAKKRKYSKKKKRRRRSRRRRPSWPIPVPKRTETQSAGTPNHGRLYHPSVVPMDGKNLAVRISTRSRRNHYGNRALVETLQFAADEVAALDPNARLFIGDASSENGGRLGSHKSHQTGLDVDIAFYVRDKDGNFNTTGQFYKLNRRGVTHDGKWRLDAELSWVFVEALLRSPKADVQYLFVYNPLKEMILEAGRQAGADPRILEKASYVMQQPRRSSPHADHFHLRVYCPPGDRDDACTAYGIIWPWIEGIQPNKFSYRASNLGGKKTSASSLAWSVDGTSLSACEVETDSKVLGDVTMPLDGDFVCVDPKEYQEFEILFEKEELENPEEETLPEEEEEFLLEE